MDSDHNRSVVTFAGKKDAVIEGAVRGVAKAAELIDLTAHEGVHPRVGAADVVPFIPLGSSTMEDAVAAAYEAGQEIWKRAGVPVYFYGAAARRESRRRLEKVRRKGFDGSGPDVGSIPAHPTAGASVLGARDFLLAYNFDLATPDIAVAQAIARTVRESSGGIPHVKAIGLFLASRGRAQVSMNLTDYAHTDLNGLARRIDEEAAKLGTSVVDGEVIGFVPQAAYNQAPAFFARDSNFHPLRILETRLEALSLKQYSGAGLKS
jgi:glutamate formiminotransferase